jgi:TonB family protein
MKRAVLISFAAHVVTLILFWQVSRSLSNPVPRGYPRLITATLVAKPVAASSAIGQPAAIESKPVASPAPTFKPVEKKNEPEKTPLNLKPSTTKQNAAPASASSSATGNRGSTTKTGAGSGVSGGGNALKLDVVDFPFPHYITRIQYRIENNWEPPFSGQGQLLATVYFKIIRSGEITEVKLEQSSGDIVFDQAAQRAVYNANPLPPLPEGYGQPTLGVHFDFVAY